MATGHDVALRVTRTGSMVLLVLATVAAVAGGLSVAAGVAGGGAVALVNFRWLARSVARAGAETGVPRGFGIVGGAARQLATFGALTALIATGLTHPVGVIGGLMTLPPILVVEGLRAARGD